LDLKAFCYLGLLRFPEQMERSLALMPEDLRTEASNFLATVKDLPRTELVHRWSQLRSEEASVLARKSYQMGGFRPDDLSSVLRDWYTAWLSDRIDHG
jgi:hypothetical protein